MRRGLPPDAFYTGGGSYGGLGAASLGLKVTKQVLADQPWETIRSWREDAHDVARELGVEVDYSWWVPVCDELRRRPEYGAWLDAKFGPLRLDVIYDPMSWYWG